MNEKTITGRTVNQFLTAEQQQQIRKSWDKGKKEAKRAAPPWGLILLAGALVALGTACIVFSI